MQTREHFVQALLLPSVLPSPSSIPTPFKSPIKEQGNGRAEAHKRVYFYNRRVRSFLTKWYIQHSRHTHAQNINREVTECHVTYYRTVEAPKKKKEKKRRRKKRRRRQRRPANDTRWMSSYSHLHRTFFLYPTGLQRCSFGAIHALTTRIEGITNDP